MKNGGQMRITDREFELIKATFAENDTLLKTMRKVFYQIELTDKDIEILSVLQGEEIAGVLRKIFLPEIGVDYPLGQNVDLWMTIKVEGKTPHEILLELIGREKVIDYVEAGLQRLQLLNKKTKKSFQYFVLNRDEDEEEDTTTDLLARNTLISHVEQQLIQLRSLSGMKKETVEETKTRLAKDSVK